MTCEQEEEHRASNTTASMTPENLYNMVCSMEQQSKETEAAIKAVNQEIDKVGKAITKKENLCTNTEKEIVKLSEELLNAQREFVSVEARYEAITRVRAKLEKENCELKTKVMEECCNTVASCIRRCQMREYTNAGDIIIQLQKYITTYQSLYNKLKEVKELLLAEETNLTYESCLQEGNAVQKQRPIKKEQEECSEEQTLAEEQHQEYVTAAKMRKQVTFADCDVENVVHVSAYNVNRQHNVANRGVAYTDKDCHQLRSTLQTSYTENLNGVTWQQTNLNVTCAALTREHESSARFQRINHLSDAAYRAESDAEHIKRYKTDECGCELAERKMDAQYKTNASKVNNATISHPDAFTRNSTCKPRRTVWRMSSTSTESEQVLQESHAKRKQNFP